MRFSSTVFAGVALFGTALAAGTARADAPIGLRVSLDWEKLAIVLREGDVDFLPRERWRPPGDVAKPAAASGATEPKLFGVSPHVSLVARDWSGAQLLVGHLALTDEIRLSRSSRMVVTRVRTRDGRILPFVQAGFGQWRVDTDLMPVLPQDTEIAGQVGGGVEVAVWRRAAIAVEADYTILYREAHEPQMVTGPHLWGTFVAARASFE